MSNLILGVSGQIGGNLATECELRQQPFQGTWYRWPQNDATPLDVRDAEAVAGLIAECQPEVVYLVAGMTQIDYAETDRDECHAINGTGAENVAMACAQHRAKLVYVSSSHVFGECPTSRKEDSPTAALNVYGKSVVHAENAIRAALPEQHLIVRTSHVYGPEERAKNPALHAVRRLSDRRKIRAAMDRHCQPTYGPDLAAAIFDLIKHDCVGTYHAVGPDKMTEYAFASMVAFLNGFDSDDVEAASAVELGEEAVRSRTLWLDRAKLRSELGAKAFRSVGEGLRHLRDAEMIPAARQLRAA